ncbi:UDP-N-acetylmuramoyl-L-alanine--D-glutamate ligase [Oscillatoria sp. FACHB-1407]|uniref:UDP-N-acetylmuramoyl-L-alanine--D-glutamate ligase n=1 Tax=Oscillatoria sp. FACHB-1407 TaxID=2692847 RepID=UPI0016825270|nr:UDP-N-acetylmuramoyl-L-alanine--D-glutamate ligase [Oscillatoria sp. FACHB-1407]MBD2464495.1 UDP-N-acetylmuramoyl-L-alanine--D-glutamate ligase [Oscillatoria sp. FACHB-1407]
MQNAYVIGLGQSGISAARLLKREGWHVTISDRNLAEALAKTQQQLEAESIAVKLGHTFEPDPVLMQRVVVSPGVRWDLPALVKARELGIETMGEVELAWRSLQSYPWVGITGTNGKTTTTALIAAIFQAAGLNAPACGNIGYAVCEVALTVPSGQSSDPNAKPLDWVIAELSSYQIEASIHVAPQIGVWTTFTPDHLNRHYTLENYFNIKAQLLNQSQYRVLNGDDPYLRETLHHTEGDRWESTYWTSVTGRANLPGKTHQGAYIEDGLAWFQDEPIVPVSALRMVGVHNHQNLLMAVATARLAGIPKEAIAQAVHDFPGVSHRLELIRTRNGIQFINDSKATNYDAAQVGLSAVERPVILIAGGEAKAGDDAAWLNTIQEKVTTVLLIGSAAPAFAQRLKEATTCPFEIVETMDRAVVRGAELAPQTQAKVVLLSPACASFDQYQNFEQRGDHFRQLCLAL